MAVESPRGGRIQRILIDVGRSVVDITTGMAEKILPGQGARKIVSKSKEDALRDNQRLTFPAGVMDSLDVAVLLAHQRTGEDEDIYQTLEEIDAPLSIKGALIELIRANKGKSVTPRRVAEYLVPNAKGGYQEVKRFGMVTNKMDEGSVSRIDTVLTRLWPTEDEIKDYSHAGS